MRTQELLQTLMRPEKRPKGNTLRLIGAVLMSKVRPAKAQGIGAVAARTGKSYEEITSETLEMLKSCRAVVEADPETFRPNALDTLDKMIRSLVASRRPPGGPT
jgi:hypothetical protein